MPPRAMWTGQLRLSLVSFGVRLYAGTESAKKVSMNQLHKDCHQRIRQQLTCPVHGTINRDEIVKGYEYEKDSYVIIDQDDLDAIKLKSTKSIELIQFVDADEIDPLYVNAPYYLGPDGPVATGPYRVIHEAMRRSKKIGIGTVTMHGREQIVALQVSGKGFMLTTLRYPSEVRQGDQYFSEVADAPIDDEQIELAESIMQSKVARFEPGKFHDQYQEAFFELVKAKLEGQAPVVVQDDEPSQAFNFMDALRQSVTEAEESATAAPKKVRKKTPRKKPAAKSVPASKKRARKGA